MDWIDEQLGILQQRGLRRRLSTRTGAQSAMIVIEGKETINFGSNDYLNLASEPRLTVAVEAALHEYGWGSGASPLVTGHAELHRRLEQRLAQFEGTEAALVFTSGYAANTGTVAALAAVGDVVLLVFSEAGLEKWNPTKIPANTTLNRKFSLSDGFAVPGVYSTGTNVLKALIDERIQAAFNNHVHTVVSLGAPTSAPMTSAAFPVLPLVLGNGIGQTPVTTTKVKAV